MKAIEILDVYTSTICEMNPDKLYVFGENKRQQNSNITGGGQAVIRKYFNSFGFCTLEAIGLSWTDDNFMGNMKQIEKDIVDLKIKSNLFNTIVFPKYGLGTGRASMIKCCPKTFLYMCGRLLDEFGYNNIEFLQSPKF